MALTDSIMQAQKMGASANDILGEIAKQNANTPMAQNIQKAMSSGYNADDVLKEILAQNGSQTPPAEVNAKPPVDNGFLGFIKNAGEDIGQSLYAGKAAKVVAANVAAHSNDIQKLSDRSKEMKAAGQDTSHIDDTIRKLLNDSPSQYGGDISAIIPVINKSKEQIIGDMGGLAAGLLTAGGALAPAAAGAAFGLTHALSNDKGVGGALVDTAVGALGGKIAEVGFNALSPYINKVVAAYGTPILEKLAQYIPESAMPALKGIAAKAGTAVEGANAGSDAISSKISEFTKGFGSQDVNAPEKFLNDKASKILASGKEKILGTVEEQAQKKAQSAVQKTVDALNPDVSGKAKINAYKKVATGAREATPASIFKEQGLAPDQATANLGKRLSDLNLDPKDHIGNLEKLGKNLGETEDHLQTALKGDPEVQYNLDKPALATKLDALKADKPGDFIGDNGKIYDNVITEGKKIISKAEDSISGGRDARTLFDAKAKAKFPSAFKEGKLDSSTPAGHAIKAVRETINEHIYNTAPNGSDVQKLIGREADIFRAIDNVAPKAAAKHGQTSVQMIKELIKKHPVLSTLSILEAGNLAKKFFGSGGE